MDQLPCSFACNNSNNQHYRNRARTFQPQMHVGRNPFDWDTSMPQDKDFILKKYLTSTNYHPHAEHNQVNYANVPPDKPQDYAFYHQRPHPHHIQHPSSRPTPHHQHNHTRSQSHSHHLYPTMAHHCAPGLYYNIQSKPTAIETNTLRRSPPQIHDAPIMSPQMHSHGKLDPLMVMQVCNEIGENHIDEAMPIPKSRDYTVATSRDGNLYRFGFPQKRYLIANYTDPVRNITLPKNQSVTVLGPTQGDRSKFTVCYNGCCGQTQLDIQHQLTKLLPL